jgi:SCP-2 sterol transfer family
VLPPPAASTVYQLTEHGEALRPAVYALIRWGGRFLYPRRRGDRIEPDWMRLALDALARRRASPSRRFLLRVREGRKEALVHLSGGRRGTTVSLGAASAETTLALDVPTLLAVAAGHVSLARAIEEGTVEASGDLSALTDFAQLFESPASAPTSG